VPGLTETVRADQNDGLRPEDEPPTTSQHPVGVAIEEMFTRPAYPSQEERSLGVRVVVT